jgi:type I restriction enzyme, S subunit
LSQIFKYNLVKDLGFVKTGVKNFKGEKKYYSTSSIKPNFISEEGIFSFKTKPSRANRVAITNDIIQAKMQNTNKALLINKELNDQLFSTGFFQLRPSKNVALPKFVYYWLYSKDFNLQKDKLCTGSTQEAINDRNLSKIDLLAPSIDLQNKIIIKLDDFFINLEKTILGIQKNIENSQLLFESTLNKILIELDLKPNQKILSAICTVKDGTHDSPKYVKKGIPFITQKNIRKDGLNFDKIKFISKEDHEKFYKRSNVAFGDILISMIGANRGMSALVDDKRLFSIKNVGLVKKGNILDQNYLLYFLRSKQAHDYMKFVSKGGAQDFISLTALRNFPIIAPPREVQEKVVKKIDSFIFLNKSLEKNYNEKLKLLNDLKDSILSQVFNGKFSKLLR